MAQVRRMFQPFDLTLLPPNMTIATNKKPSASSAVTGAGAGHVDYQDPIFKTPPPTATALLAANAASPTPSSYTLHCKSAFGAGADAAIAALLIDPPAKTIVPNVALPYTMTINPVPAQTHMALLWRFTDSLGNLHEDADYAYKIPPGNAGQALKAKLDGHWGKIVSMTNPATGQTKDYWVWRPLAGAGFARSELSPTVLARIFAPGVEKLAVAFAWDAYFAKHAQPEYGALPSQTWIVEDDLNTPSTGYWLVVADATTRYSKHQIQDVQVFGFCGFTAANKRMASAMGAATWSQIPVGRTLLTSQATVMARSA